MFISYIFLHFIGSRKQCPSPRPLSPKLIKCLIQTVSAHSVFPRRRRRRARMRDTTPGVQQQLQTRRGLAYCDALQRSLHGRRILRHNQKLFLFFFWFFPQICKCLYCNYIVTHAHGCSEDVTMHYMHAMSGYIRADIPL